MIVITIALASALLVDCGESTPPPLTPVPPTPVPAAIPTPTPEIPAVPSPVLRAAWTSYSNANYVNDMAFDHDGLSRYLSPE